MAHVRKVFLFTDIEGSTRLWEEFPEGMRVALSKHDQILRESIETHRGEVFKTVGDAFYAAFDAVNDAVLTCREAQSRLHNEEWGEVGKLKVRIAVHLGDAESREGDYFGPPLNRVARLLAIGHGGQTLLSDEAAQMLGDNLPEGLSLSNLGAHRLKDLSRGAQVWQLNIDGCPLEFPPLRSLSSFATNLPPQTTALFGRERELESVSRALAESRLVTLTGSGGTGKTRLSLQLGADLLERFPDGVWFVELAVLTDPNLVPQAVASVLKVREQGSRPIGESVLESLSDRNLLLILDNCEHVLEGVATFVDAVMRRCPAVRILASSREPLALPYEVQHRVPSLALPDESELADVAAAAANPSVALFVDRASAILPSFELNPSNVKTVCHICRRLDGIPLALELAAARVRVLPIDQIETRLDDRFRLLTGGSRTALPRHQTLRAMIDWSYGLLTTQEATLLRRLSVFSGAFTLEAAEAVCANDEIDAYEVLDLLAALVDKSLVVYDDQGEVARYRMMETIRQYARDRLLETSEAAAIRSRHRDHYLAFAERSQVRQSTEGIATVLKDVAAEIDNLRAAMEWSIAEADSPLDPNLSEPEACAAQKALRFVAALWRFWYTRGHYAEGIEFAGRALDREDSQRETSVRAHAFSAAGNLSRLPGAHQAARTYQEEALRIRRALGDKRGVAYSLSNLGVIVFEQGDVAGARSLWLQALEQLEALNQLQSVATILNNLGEFEHKQGDLKAARGYLERSLSIARQLGDADAIGLAISNLGPTLAKMGEIDTARRYLEEGYRIFTELSDRRSLSIVIGAIAQCYRYQDRMKEAAYLFGMAEGIREAIGVVIPPSDIEDQLLDLAEVREALGVDVFVEEYEQGRTSEPHEAEHLILVTEAVR